jgi:hypothetical protein
MTTPNHIAQGIVITYCILEYYKIDKKIYWIISAIILSALPDVARFFQSNPDDWNLAYAWLHNLSNVYWIPFVNLHALADYFIHDVNGVIQPYYLISEILTWVLMGWIVKEKMYARIR